MGNNQQTIPQDIYLRGEASICVLLLEPEQQAGVWDFRLLTGTRASPSSMAGPKNFTETLKPVKNDDQGVVSGDEAAEMTPPSVP